MSFKNNKIAIILDIIADVIMLILYIILCFERAERTFMFVFMKLLVPFLLFFLTFFKLFFANRISKKDDKYKYLKRLSLYSTLILIVDATIMGFLIAQISFNQIMATISIIVIPIFILLKGISITRYNKDLPLEFRFIKKFSIIQIMIGVYVLLGTITFFGMQIGTNLYSSQTEEITAEQVQVLFYILCFFIIFRAIYLVLLSFIHLMMIISLYRYAKHKKELSFINNFISFINFMIKKYIFFFISVTFNIIEGTLALINKANSSLFIYIAIFFYSAAFIKLVTFITVMTMSKDHLIKKENIKKSYLLMIISSVIFAIIFNLFLLSTNKIAYKDIASTQGLIDYILFTVPLTIIKIVALSTSAKEFLKTLHPFNASITSINIVVFLYSFMGTCAITFNIAGMTAYLNVKVILTVIYVLVVIISNITLINSFIMGIRGYRGKINNTEFAI